MTTEYNVPVRNLKMFNREVSKLNRKLRRLRTSLNRKDYSGDMTLTDVIDLAVSGYTELVEKYS